MVAYEPIQGLPYPAPGDAPDGPTQIKALADAVAPKLVMAFATTTARDAAITTPVEGMVAVTGTGTSLAVWLYRNAGWRDWTPRPEGAEITVGTGYTAIGGSFVTPMAYKSPGGLITIQGLIRRTGSSISAGASGTIATLPAGFRPSGTHYAIMNKSTAPVSFQTSSAGVITQEVAGDWVQDSTYVALDATFQAAP